ncbi:MAG: DUF4397 domain-containing protein [Pseudomonadota bacterium]
MRFNFLAHTPRLAGVLIAAVLVVGCTDTQETADGRGTIRGLHAIPDLGAVTFLIEETRVPPNGGQINYLSATPTDEYDALTYDFNFDFTSGQTREVTRLLSTEVSVAVDTSYTFVLHGQATAPQITVLDTPIREFGAADTVLELWFANFSQQVGPVDFYLGDEGLDPAANTPLATNVAPATATTVVEIETQLSEFVVTPAGDPATILMRSEVTTLSAQNTLLVTLLDSAGEVNGDFVLSISGEGLTNAVAVDDRALPTVQFSNASAASGAIDIYRTSDLTTPLVADLAVGEITAPIEIPEGDDLGTLELTFTPMGNVGVILEQEEFSFSNGRNTVGLFVGRQAEDNAAFVQLPLSRRTLFDAAQFGLYNAILDTTRVDFYLIEEDETLETDSPRAGNLPSLFEVEAVTLPPETLDVVVTDTSDNGVLAGPLELTLAAGDIVRVVLVDTSDPTQAEIVILRPLTAQ